MEKGLATMDDQLIGLDRYMHVYMAVPPEKLKDPIDETVKVVRPNAQGNRGPAREERGCGLQVSALAAG